MSTDGTHAEPWTVARLLSWTQDYFKRSSLESPRLCAEILLAHALSCERIELYTRHELVPPATVLDTFRESVKQAAGGRPIAYLTGRKEFFSLDLEVNPDVLIPRPETEVLVERVIHLSRHGDEPIRSILDVGTGSGCIAIALAKNLPDASIVATDVSEDALRVAQRNAAKHRVTERVSLVHADLFDGTAGRAPFDVIVSNPPYVAESEADDLPKCVRDFEPHLALFAGADGLDMFQRLLDGAPEHLRPGGHLLTEVAYNQAGRVRALLDETRWRDIVTYRDALNHERVVHARRRASDQSQVA